MSQLSRRSIPSVKKHLVAYGTFGNCQKWAENSEVADTTALCGRRVSWDLSVEIEAHYFKHSCPQCALMFAADNNETKLESSGTPQRVVVRHAPPLSKKSVTWITKLRDWV